MLSASARVGRRLSDGGDALANEPVSNSIGSGALTAFMEEDLARALAPTVNATSAAALRDAVRMLADLGTDKFLLVPTTADPDEVGRVADVLG